MKNCVLSNYERGGGGSRREGHTYMRESEKDTIRMYTHRDQMKQ